MIHTRIQQMSDGRVHFPGCEHQLFPDIIALVESESNNKLKTPCQVKQGSFAQASTTKVYIGDEGKLRSSNKHSSVFVLARSLGDLSDLDKVIQDLEKNKELLLSDCKEDYSLEDKTFWLGQVTKYLHIIRKHIKEAHSEEKPERSCLICKVISSELNIGDLS